MTLTIRRKINIHTALILNISAVMLIFSLCRILFYIFNRELLGTIAFGDMLTIMRGGLRFDISAVLYTNILYIALQIIPFKFRASELYQTISKWIFLITNSIAIGLNCIDIIYFRFTLRRTTWSVFSEFSNDVGNVKLIGRFFLDYWYIFVVYCVLIFLLYRFIRIFVVDRRPIIANPILYYGLNTFLMAVYMFLFVGGARGGFIPTIRPITLSNAMAYTTKPIETGLILNTPFSIYRTITQPSYPRYDLFEEGELEQYYDPIHYPNDTLVFTPKNVVVFIVESLSKEYIGSLNQDLDNYKGYTPFLDSLVEQGYTFAHSFSNGLKSIDAMPSVLAGIPSIPNPFVLSIYSNNKIKGLASHLADKGYDCSFFHGAPNGSMGFDAIANNTGFQYYYGKTEYNNDDDVDGNWGIWDEPFLQYMARTLETKQEPFFASVFTLTSHHPFVIPKEYEGKFDKGSEPIHQCIGYTDMALRRFFETASKMPWFKNTLFVITADHTNYQVVYEKSKTSLGRFAVPVIFYDPSGELRGYEEHRTIQQIDIMPSVLGYLNYDKPFFAFGHNAFASDSLNRNFATNYFNGLYQIYWNEYILRMHGDLSPEALFDYSKDPLLLDDLKYSMPDITTKLNNLGKAFMQTHNDLLNDNKMVYDAGDD